MFNGTVPITLDYLRNHYFIDRDGQSFRHILNYLRYGEVVLPTNYSELEILHQEADFYQIQPLLEIIESKLSKS